VGVLEGGAEAREGGGGGGGVCGGVGFGAELFGVGGGDRGLGLGDEVHGGDPEQQARDDPGARRRASEAGGVEGDPGEAVDRDEDGDEQGEGAAEAVVGAANGGGADPAEEPREGVFWGGPGEMGGAAEPAQAELTDP
jgi:hypothetical protein